MANKKRRTSAGAARSEQQTPAQEFNPTALQGAFRLISLMGGVAAGIWAFELLQKPLTFWPAIIIGLVVAFLARLLLIWLERLWIRALIRRAERHQLERVADSIEQSKPKPKPAKK